MSNRHRVVTQRRTRFRLRGIPWSSDAVVSGLDETGRKQVERDLDDLVGRGLAEVEKNCGELDASSNALRERLLEP